MPSPGCATRRHPRSRRPATDPRTVRAPRSDTRAAEPVARTNRAIRHFPGRTVRRTIVLVTDTPRFCEQCGAPLAEGIVFCESCGHAVPAAAPAVTAVAPPALAVAPAATPRRGVAWVPLVIGLIGVLLIVVAIVSSR